MASSDRSRRRSRRKPKDGLEAGPLRSTYRASRSQKSDSTVAGSFEWLASKLYQLKNKSLSL